MTTDNRTSEPTKAMIEAATEAMEDYYDRWSGPGEQSPTYAEFAEVALVAAQGAAPQAATAHSPVHFECDCVPNLGPPHCHACSDEIGNPVMWSACPNADPVLPSSTVGEGELEHRVEEVIRDVVDMPLSTRLVLARAVVEAIGGETRAARE